MLGTSSMLLQILGGTDIKIIAQAQIESLVQIGTRKDTGRMPITNTSQ
jgi:hypothetical protein